MMIIMMVSYFGKMMLFVAMVLMNDEWTVYDRRVMTSAVPVAQCSGHWNFT